MLAALMAIGCSRDHGNEVTGIVRLDGEPLSGGKITFFHPKFPGRNVTAYIQPDGSFKVLWVPSGDVTATVVALPPQRKDREAKQSRQTRLKVPNVPLKYTDPETSDLIIQISSGEQNLEIDLQS